MYDLLHKILTTGLETQDKVVAFLDELVTKGKINDEERKNFLEDLDKKLLNARDKGEALVNDVISSISSKNPFANKHDLENLETKVKNLEKRIKKLEGTKEPKAKTKTTKKEPAK